MFWFVAITIIVILVGAALWFAYHKPNDFKKVVDQTTDVTKNTINKTVKDISEKLK